MRKVESSCEENTIIGRGSSAAISTSPVTSASSKFYKNLKKIKRNHGSENPTKNYYLAFPALNSKKTSATVASGGSGISSPGEVCDTKKDSNLQLLCWSNLMLDAKENAKALTPLSPAQDDDKMAVVGRRRRTRQRRYGRYKRSNRSDVQCNAKAYEDAYDSSPKAKNDSKKHQRNQSGKKSYKNFPKDLQREIPEIYKIFKLSKHFSSYPDFINLSNFSRKSYKFFKFSKLTVPIFPQLHQRVN